jgi:PAS domain S-box-containing protein
VHGPLTAVLLDVMPLPMSTLDGEGRYLSVNRAWEEFKGLRREDVVGRPARQLLPEAESQIHDARDRELLAQGGRVRYEAAARHRDGSMRDLAITKAVVPGTDERPASIVAAFMDVTEFREAERATREARDAAEEASRSKTEFIGNISHELRTPLQAILGFSELGKMRSGAQPKLGMMFADIHAAGHRMLALVNDLLDVAKIESTVGTFHLERTDVRALVREVAGELAPLIQARYLKLDLQLSDAPLVAKVDPLRFQQVLRNVMANAIRFSPEGAPLLVQGDIDPDTRIQLAVVDQGPGIPDAELEQIFEAFVQSSKTKDGSGGTGLGLAISRKILQAHGGEIRAENNPGGGSTFRIYLPSRGFADTQPQA